MNLQQPCLAHIVGGMEYLNVRNVEELMVQGGVALAATVSWCASSSTNAMLSTYIACLLPVLLVVVPEYWTHLDVIFVEPVQIRRLATWERHTRSSIFL